MRQSNWFKEISKSILLIVATIILIVLGTVYFSGTHYESALIGAAAGSGGLSIFQLSRLFGFAKNPKKFKKEQIDVTDERNILIMTKAKASSFGIETYVIFGMTMYGIYLDNVEFVVAILVLWLSRIISFFYFLSKNDKAF